ncbi:exported hypothetical protein [Candidatus Sulfopaludibacter sp. SbA3]|nr:exported hypothetical protein [Candidatus Sulfopaludibacter sp. SbA3]
MKIARIVLPLTMLAAAGFAQDVRYNFDKGAQFSTYKTYKWVQVKDAPKLNPLVDQQVRAAIEAELTAKGLTKATGEQADIWIAYQFTLAQEKEFSSYSTDFGYGGGWGRGWYGGGGMGSTMTTSVNWRWTYTIRHRSRLSGGERPARRSTQRPSPKNAKRISRKG